MKTLAAPAREADSIGPCLVWFIRTNGDRRPHYTWSPLPSLLGADNSCGYRFLHLASCGRQPRSGGSKYALSNHDAGARTVSGQHPRLYADIHSLFPHASVHRTAATLLSDDYPANAIARTTILSSAIRHKAEKSVSRLAALFKRRSGDENHKTSKKEEPQARDDSILALSDTFELQHHLQRRHYLIERQLTAVRGRDETVAARV
jgi:hypothetical protein